MIQRFACLFFLFFVFVSSIFDGVMALANLDFVPATPATLNFLIKLI